jgi:Zn-dependent peptidase ImmA (M78 family)
MPHQKDTQIYFERKPKTKKRRVRVGASDYSVIICSKLEFEQQAVEGVCDRINKVIYVNALSPKDDMETLLHEMVHGAMFEYGIIQHDNWCPQLEEVVVEVVSKLIAANFSMRLRG